MQTDENVLVGDCLSPAGGAKWYLEASGVARALGNPG